MGWQDVDERGEPTGELLHTSPGTQVRATVCAEGLHLARWVAGAGGRWSLHHAMSLGAGAVKQLLIVLRGWST